MFSRIIGEILLFCIGYSLDRKIFDRVKNERMVVIIPHTSKFDAVIGCILGLIVKDYIAIAITAKHMDRWIIGRILSYFGGFRIPRSENGKSNTVNLIISYLQKNPKKSLVLSPEGRLIAANWKSGFYNIAKGIDAPIVIAGIDYYNKRVMIDSDNFRPGDNYENDLSIIQNNFSNSEIFPLFPKNSVPYIKNSPYVYSPISIPVILSWVLSLGIYFSVKKLSIITFIPIIVEYDIRLFLYFSKYYR